MTNRNIILEIVNDTWYAIKTFVIDNLQTFANILNLIAPYAMYFIGQSVALQREGIAIGGEVFVPLVFILVIYLLKSCANKLGKGIIIPVPNKRFTEVDDGEVSIENERVQELLLYMADLEDWLEKRNLL